MYVVATVHRGEHTHTHAHTHTEWLSEGNATSTQLCSAFRVLLVAASAVGLGRVQLPRQSSDEEKRREEEDDREERSERVSRETEERERERERSSTRRVHGSGLRTQDMDLTARLVYPSLSLSSAHFPLSFANSLRTNLRPALHPVSLSSLHHSNRIESNRPERGRVNPTIEIDLSSPDEGEIPIFARSFFLQFPVSSFQFQGGWTRARGLLQEEAVRRSSPTRLLTSVNVTAGGSPRGQLATRTRVKEPCCWRESPKLEMWSRKWKRGLNEAFDRFLRSCSPLSDEWNCEKTNRRWSEQGDVFSQGGRRRLLQKNIDQGTRSEEWSVITLCEE